MEGLAWAEGGGFSCRQSRRSDAGVATATVPAKSIVDSTLTPRARSAALKLVPQE